MGFRAIKSIHWLPGGVPDSNSVWGALNSSIQHQTDPYPDFVQEDSMSDQLWEQLVKQIEQERNPVKVAEPAKRLKKLS